MMLYTVSYTVFYINLMTHKNFENQLNGFVAIYKGTLHHASSTSLLPSPQAFSLFHF